MEDFVEKQCRKCGKVIGVRPAWEYSARWNAVQFCENCRAAKRKQDKTLWQQGNRKSCRETNKALTEQNRAAKAYIAALEEAEALQRQQIMQLTQQNDELRRYAARLEKQVRPGMGETPFSALRRRQSGDKAEKTIEGGLLT